MTWTNEETSQIIEFVQNDKFIEWGYWADLKNITPAQAARLVQHIDPIIFPDYKYSQGGIKCDMPDDMRLEIIRLTQRLESNAQFWTLADLVIALGDDLAPFGMVQAVKAKQKTEDQSKNQQRDEDYKIWLEEISTSSNSDIDVMTKADIQAALILRNRTLWTSGFNDWVKYTGLYAGKRGRKRG